MVVAVEPRYVDVPVVAAATRAQIEVCDAVASLHIGRIELVPQAKVQRELVVDLPIVLYIKMQEVRAHVHVDGVGGSELSRCAEQEVPRGIARAPPHRRRALGESSVVRNGAHGPLRIVDKALQPPGLDAKLDCVVTPGVGRVRGGLPGLGLDQVRTKRVVAELRIARKVHFVRAPQVLVESRNSEFGIDVLGDIQMRLDIGIEIVPASAEGRNDPRRPHLLV